MLSISNELDIRSILDELKEIRLGTIVELSGNKGKPKAIYKLEEMSEIRKEVVNAIEIEEFHNSRPKINGLSVYK